QGRKRHDSPDKLTDGIYQPGNPRRCVAKSQQKSRWPEQHFLAFQYIESCGLEHLHCVARRKVKDTMQEAPVERLDHRKPSAGFLAGVNQLQCPHELFFAGAVMS